MTSFFCCCYFFSSWTKHLRKRCLNRNFSSLQVLQLQAHDELEEFPLQTITLPALGLEFTAIIIFYLFLLLLVLVHFPVLLLHFLTPSSFLSLLHFFQFCSRLRSHFHINRFYRMFLFLSSSICVFVRGSYTATKVCQQQTAQCPSLSNSV